MHAAHVGVKITGGAKKRSALTTKHIVTLSETLPR